MGTRIRLIIGDSQAIFRAGAARVVAREEDMRVVAQCEDGAALKQAVTKWPGAIVMVNSAMVAKLPDLGKRLKKTQSRGLLVAENREEVPEDLEETFAGLVSRNVSPAELVKCIRMIALGEPCYARMPKAKAGRSDDAGARVRDQLTPKELQILALVVEGRKNSEIAIRLRTKEQVVKNSMRNIFDKAGVSDRLELALFAIHHPTLSAAADRAASLLRAKS